MKRSIISMIGILTFCAFALSASSAIAIDGPLANATVSFGQWESDPPLDRLLGDPAMGVGNNHEMIPQIATIKEGGSVSFIISGGHVVAVYDDGTQPGDIDTSVTEPGGNCPGTAGGVINDPIDRIYRGPCFSTSSGITSTSTSTSTGGITTTTTTTTTITRRDGVEVVQFSKPGTYLVICARKNHFAPPAGGFEMFGFVKVLPGK